MIGFLTCLWQSASVFGVTFIAIDRYVAIVHCMKYASWSSRRYFFAVFATIWLLAFVVSACPLFGWGSITYDAHYHTCIVTWHRCISYAITVTSVVFVLPFLLLNLSYFGVVNVARLHWQRIACITEQLERSTSEIHSVHYNDIMMTACLQPALQLFVIGNPAKNDNRIDVVGRAQMQTCAANSRDKSSRNMSPTKRQFWAAAKILRIIIAFLICWILFVYVQFYDSMLEVGNVPSESNAILKSVAIMLSMLFSVINPFIYEISDKGFRIAAKHVYIRSWLGHQTADIGIRSHVNGFLKRSPSIVSDPTYDRRRPSFVGSLLSLPPRITQTHFISQRLDQEFFGSIPSTSFHTINCSDSVSNFLEVPSLGHVSQAPSTSSSLHSIRSAEDRPERRINKTYNNSNEFILNSNNAANIRIQLDLLDN